MEEGGGAADDEEEAADEGEVQVSGVRAPSQEQIFSHE